MTDTSWAEGPTPYSPALPGPNAEAIEAWDKVLFDDFVRYRYVLTTGAGAHGARAMDRLGSLAGKRVLDVGCGFGDTTQELARRVGPEGEAVGVDAASRFIEAAKSEARAAGIANARFAIRDAQLEDLSGPYDVAFSRMGVMFFADAVQAFRNLHKALREDGRLCLVVWRKRADNPWLHTAQLAVENLVRVPEVTDAVTCGPGPFSMAGADLVSSQLMKAGFRGVTFERLDVEYLMGRDMDEAIAFALALGSAGELLRLAGEDTEKRRAQVTAALREAFAPYVTANGVLASSSTWIITARR
jgi:SAM-dependent methyltransferase